MYGFVMQQGDRYGMGVVIENNDIRNLRSL